MSPVMTVEAMQPDLDGLRRFSHAPDKMDKERTWFFVGRNEIINAINQTVYRLQQQMERRPVNEVDFGEQTWLIQGAPGAGKSTLLQRLRELWDEQFGAPIPVEIRLKQLREQSKLTAFIANQIVADGSRILNTMRNIEISGEFDSEQLRSKGTVRESRQPGTMTIEDLSQLYDSRWQQRLQGKYPNLTKLMSSINKRRIVVLIVDEIQALSPEGEELLQALHIGMQGLPIVLLLAGLAWSRSRLVDAGISRFSDDGLDHVQTLGRLETGESAQAVRLMLTEFNIDAAARADLPEKIAEWSNGWPQHLHHYLRALARQLAANQGMLTAVDEFIIQQIGNQKRRNYYLDRLQDKRIGISYRLLAEVAKFIGSDGCHHSDLLDLLDHREWSKGKLTASVMPRGMSAEEFISVMVRTGVVHNVNSFITIPIPSYRQFLIDWCEEVDRKVHLRTQ